MTDQTPSTEYELVQFVEEAMRDAWTDWGENAALPQLLATRIAARDREVAASTLREAADALAALDRPEALAEAVGLLDARATSIGAGDGS